MPTQKTADFPHFKHSGYVQLGTNASQALGRFRSLGTIPPCPGEFRPDRSRNMHAPGGGESVRRSRSGPSRSPVSGNFTVRVKTVRTRTQANAAWVLRVRSDKIKSPRAW